MVAIAASDFIASRHVPVPSQVRRARAAALAGAVLLHAIAIVLLLLVQPWKSAAPEPVIYDLVFLQPPAPPPSSAPAEEVQTPTPAPPAAVVEPEPEPVPAPVLKAAPLPPSKPVVRPRPRPQPSAPSPQVAEAPPLAASQPLALSAPAAPPAVASAPAARPAPDPAYAATLLSWLGRYKEYPWAARRRGVQGQVVLRLAVARSGRVAATAIETSSGTDVLDEAALDMVHRAEPLPPLPASFPGDVAEFRVPISFALSQR